MHFCDTTTALWLLHTLSLADFAASAPNSLQEPSTSPLLPTSIASLTNSTLFDPSSYVSPSIGTTHPLADIEHWVYSIPDTTLFLRMAAFPPRTIDHFALAQTILKAQTRVRKHIRQYGDGELWDEDDRTLKSSYPRIPLPSTQEETRNS